MDIKVKESTWKKLDSQFSEFPILKGGAAAVEDVDAASELTRRVFPTDYRDFLLRYGGAIVGPYPIFGVKPVEPMGNMWSVVEVNRHYRSDRWPGVDELLVISRDHAGNPIGLREDGEVWVSDHGALDRVAANFEEYLVIECLRD